MRFNLTYMADYSQNDADGTGCHEFGHTGGLGHRTSQTDTDNNSCMRSPSDGRRYYDQHDLNAISSNN